MDTIELIKNNLYIEFCIDEQQRVSLNNLSVKKNEKGLEGYFPLIQIHCSGFNQNDHHARKHTGSEPGSSLRYQRHNYYDNESGTKIEIYLKGDELSAVYHLQHYENLQTITVWCEVVNCSTKDIGLEYISSFSAPGISRKADVSWDKYSVLHIAHNNWYGEAQWISRTLPELGLTKVNEFSLDRISVENTGSWSSIGHLPCAVYENKNSGEALLWQIEHNGSWQWEIGDYQGELYLLAGGPNENENHCWVSLAPNKKFTTVPVSACIVEGGLQEAIQEITRYRRKIIRQCDDIKTLPVIFNDYMNCLSGDPTTEKLLPLIDAAANAGCEYFCIDCGWYSDGPWWNGVGEWLPSNIRFPQGILEPINYIIKKGMRPGLWLEIEVMGIECPLAQRLPDACFFQKHGQRVIDHQRYQLDFRHSLVREHADKVVARLVEEYGIHYIKMDYNINAGIGTDYLADSPGEGLLAHNRAYLEWLQSIFDKYPDLVIENCGSGGLRMDYALLKYHSIQSVSDQTDYKLMASIAASAASAATPEQCAIWSYPLQEGDQEEVVMNMVNSMLLRIHQSGHLAELSTRRFELVKEGIALYKTFRSDIPSMLPFWPLGMPSFDSPWLAFGMSNSECVYLAVWRMGSVDDTINMSIDNLPRAVRSVQCVYPSFDNSEYAWDETTKSLCIKFEKCYTARLFKIQVT